MNMICFAGNGAEKPGPVIESEVKAQRKRNRPLPFLTLRHLWTGLPFFILFWKGLLFPLPLLDFWWHLKMGQVILETWTIPRVDSFSFTASGKLFIVQNWLAEVLLFLIYKAGGVPLLVLLNSTLLACTLIPIFLLCRKVTPHLGVSVFAACLVACCIPCNMRPQLFSYILFAVYYWLLSLYVSGRKDRLWLLPILMAIWVNLHGAFVLGLALMAVLLISESTRILVGGLRSDFIARRRLAKLALFFVLCGISTLANPEKFGVYSYILTVMKDVPSRQFVIEWQPPAISQIQGIVQFYLPFFITAFTLIRSDRRVGITDLMLFAGFSAFGMTATRNAAWFLLVSAPILAKYLPSVRYASTPAQQSPTPPAQEEFRRTASSRKEYPALNFVIAGLAFLIVTIQSPWRQQHRGGLLDPRTPVGAMDFIERNGLTGHMFHPQAYGDYLIWRLWPQQHSFFDGRVHLFGETLVQRYQQVYGDSRGEELLSDYGIELLLLSKTEEKPQNMRIIARVRNSAEWKILYEDPISVLFERVSPKNL